MSEETLQYPCRIAEEIGMSPAAVANLKRLGCPFVGRKTSVRLVRAFLYKTTGAESLIAPDVHLQRLVASISGEPIVKNG